MRPAVGCDDELLAGDWEACREVANMFEVLASRETGARTLVLRAYQQSAINALRAEYNRGRRAPCLVLPTGGGKTVVAAEIIRSATQRGRRVLFLAHRQELIAQSVAKLEGAGVTDLRIIQAASDLGNPIAPVTVASIPTLTRWTDRLPGADLVVFDEAHHVVARTWGSLAARYPNALLLGMTATPQRGDGKPLGDIFDSLVIGSTVRELTDLGHLVRCRVWAPPEQLEAKELAIDVVAAYRQHADGQRTVVFCGSLDHARRVAADLTAVGISAEVVHGGLASQTRRSTLDRFASGALRVVVNVHVLTEGWDDPGCSVCILARKPQHAGTFLQMVGRVLRPAPGKTLARVVDLCGSVHVHGTPDADREFTLDGDGITRSDRQAIRQCPHCGSVFVSARVCPECSAELGGRPVELPRATGVGLTEVIGTPVAPREHIVLMVSKYSSTCRRCRLPIHAGERIYYATAAKQATHSACGQAEAIAEADRLLREAV